MAKHLRLTETTAMPVNRLALFGELDGAEAEFFRAMLGPQVPYAARDIIRREGAPNHGVFLLLDGWVVSSVGFADGSRQIVKIHLPGDILGAPSLPFATAVETLWTLTSATVCPISPEALGALFTHMPRMAARLFLAAQEERVILMDRLASLGRLGATGSVAALLVHLYDRLSLVEPMSSTRIQVPLTQVELGDILGLTSVHVNRVLNAMERAGHIRRSGKTFDLLDLDNLRALAGVPRRNVVGNLPWLPEPKLHAA